MFIGSICLFFLFIACSRHRPDPSTFELAPGALIETIENRSDFIIKMALPEIQYFNGYHWMVIPVNEDFAFPAILETISSNSSGSPELTRLHLDDYDLPNQG